MAVNFTPIKEDSNIVMGIRQIAEAPIKVKIILNFAPLVYREQATGKDT